ncbi:MAG: AAA family ATPase [Staphylococcus warneri]|uniref:ATP-binding protein n=1 Tax=Staphylococcus warneri TaxID=1292 RepID=UPI0004DECE91|nr:AAA family ATPase [Staphylococcus warneri]MBS6091663.1 AAA family ATPase [Staphylococcus warneri]MDU1259718.1 AAA family ATPase [Staphylococcus warneri]MDU2356752.1 AAA family ATPase [Staphylococcus warneri]MDU2912333.1 AAA family ATPase [Staphylococcus warneri]MDU2987089.1 AAA family ATPase [Staphylococcus warneri]
MIIKSLEIYGYGQFVQRNIEFNQSFTEIFGENEAGKSTIQAFIHSILFGFPTKKSKEPRLEPRLGNQYGGKLTLQLDDGNVVEVERIKGSAQGDVKVYLEDGSVRDEEWLQKKLNYISKKTYQGIFSFDVLGLQDIHRNLDEKQLQDYLLEAGALGSTEFTSMRDTISQKKDELYKKSGKNPIINQQVDQLKQLEAQIRDEEAKLDTYHRLVDEKDKSSRRLDNIKQNLNQLSKMHEEKQKEVALHDQTQEWKQLEHALNVEPLHFPEKGIDRYEAANAQRQSLLRDISLREQQLSHIKEDNQSIEPAKQSDIDAFNSLYQQENEIKQKEYELRSIEKEISDKQRDKESMQSNIGWNETYHDVDSSEAMKSHISDQIKNKQEQVAYIQQLERSIEDNKIEQNANSNELDQLENLLVPEETFEKKKEHKQQIVELNEKENLYEKLKETFEIEQERKSKRQKMLRMVFILLAIVGAALTVFAFLTQNMIFGVIFAVLTVVFVIGIFLVKSKEVDYSETITQEIDDLENQLEVLENQYDLDFDLDEQQRTRDHWQHALKNKDVLDEKSNYMNNALSKAEQRLNDINHNIEVAKQELHLSPKISDSLIVESIGTMGQIKSNDQYIDELNSKRHQVVSDLEAFYNHAEAVTQSQFTYFNKMSFFHDVKQWLKNAEDSNEKWHKNTEQSKLLNDELSQLRAHLEENNQTINELFNHIGVSTEEEYYQHHEKYQTYTNQLTRFNDLTKYLENQNYSYDASSQLSDKTTAQLNEENQLLAQQVDQYNEQYLDMQSEVSDLNAQINHMETDTTLTQLRHEYHSLKNRMNSIAKDWASLSYLQSLVDEHIKQIKDKRLPQVINEAILIFTNLTNGAYTNIYYSEEAIQVKHENGQMYQPVELSQSTKELLYVALRLSLIKVLKPYYPFPIIVDDAFVHFDKDRKERMINYLRTLSTEHQVIYFTCTNDNIVPTKEMITLNKLEKGGK